MSTTVSQYVRTITELPQSYGLTLDVLLNPANDNTYQTSPLALVTDQGTIAYRSRNPSQAVRDAREFDGIFRSYLSSDAGQHFLEYASQHSKHPLKILAYGTDEMPEKVIAAVRHDGDIGVIVGNYTEGKDFESRIQEFASIHGLEYEAALEYVLNHELGHVAGYLTESGNERFLGEYFEQRAMEEGKKGNEQVQVKYQKLAELAYERAEQQKVNAN